MWRALCKPSGEVVAIKILDLERQDPGKLVSCHAFRLCRLESKRRRGPNATASCVRAAGGDSEGGADHEPAEPSQPRLLLLLLRQLRGAPPVPLRRRSRCWRLLTRGARTCGSSCHSFLAAQS